MVYLSKLALCLLVVMNCNAQFIIQPITIHPLRPTGLMTDKEYIIYIKKNCAFSHNTCEVQLSLNSKNEITKQEMAFRDSGRNLWTAPTGTFTDGASIPWFLLSELGDRHDPDVRAAALIHDAYCGEANKSYDQYQSISRADVSHMFFEGCITLNMNVTKAKLFYLAVFLYGPKWKINGEAERYDAIARITGLSASTLRAAYPPDALEFMREQIAHTQFQIGKEWIQKMKPAFDLVKVWAEFAEVSNSYGKLLAAPDKILTKNFYRIKNRYDTLKTKYYNGEYYKYYDVYNFSRQFGFQKGYDSDTTTFRPQIEAIKVKRRKIYLK